MTTSLLALPIALPIALAAAAAALPALAAPSGGERAARGEQVGIPFAGFRIRNFHAETDEVVYLEDRARNWYRAELIGPCRDVRWARAIGIDTRGSATFDRFSAIIVEGQRCQLGSLTRSAAPERRKAGKKRG